MLSKEKFDEMQSVIADCKTLNGMAFSGNHYKVSQFQKAPALLGDALDEILSLREQLAELKALPPFSWGLADKDGNAYLSECCIGDEGCMIDEAEAYNYELEPEHHIHAVPLFTASKPAED
ncbi:TPA: hypothetical protein ACGEB1_002860 [Yersinia enterocolitica]